MKEVAVVWLLSFFVIFWGCEGVYFTKFIINSTLSETPSTPIYVHEFSLLINDDDGGVSEYSVSADDSIFGFLDGSKLIDGMTETFSFPESNSMLLSFNFTSSPQSVAGFYMLSSCDDSPSDFCTYNLHIETATSTYDFSRSIKADFYFLSIQDGTAETDCDENSLIVDYIYNSESTCNSAMKCTQCLDYIDVYQDEIDESLWHFNFSNSSTSNDNSVVSLEGKAKGNTVNEFNLYYPNKKHGTNIGSLSTTSGEHVNLRLNKWVNDNGSLYDIVCAPRYWVNEYIWLNISMYDTISIETSFKCDEITSDDISSNKTALKSFKYGFEDYFLFLFDGWIKWYEIDYVDDRIIAYDDNDGTFSINLYFDNVTSTQVGKKIEEYFSSSSHKAYMKSNLTYLIWKNFIYVGNNDSETNDTMWTTTEATISVTLTSFSMDIDLYRLEHTGNEECNVYGVFNETSSDDSDASESFFESNSWFLPTVIPLLLIFLIVIVGFAVYQRFGKKTKWQKTDNIANQDEGNVRALTNNENRTFASSKSQKYLASSNSNEDMDNINNNNNNNGMQNEGHPSPNVSAVQPSTMAFGNQNSGNGMGNGYISNNTYPNANMNRTSQLVSPIHPFQLSKGGKEMQVNTSTRVQPAFTNDDSAPMPMDTNSNNSNNGNNLSSQAMMANNSNMALSVEMNQISKERKAIEFNFSKDLKLVKCIGIGSFGKVWKATWEDNPVAVKLFTNVNVDNNNLGVDSSNNNLIGSDGSSKLSLINENDNNMNNMNDNSMNISDEAQKELFAEIVLASQIPYHPNIVKIIGFCRSPLCVVMDYMRGGSVKKLVYGEYASRKMPGLTEKLTILVKAASGLEHLHKQYVIHRDIAARNILLGDFDDADGITQETHVKVSDFGMARKMEDDNDSINASKAYMSSEQTITQVGPLKWMAPESIKNHQYSFKSDVYMWAITMWEIMYGQEPYPDSDALNAAMNVVVQNDRPPFLWPLPEELEDLMAKCWDKSPDKRPTFQQIRKTLKDIQDTEKNEAKESKALETDSE